MAIDIRTITESELPDWLRARNIGFLSSPAVSKEEVELRRPGLDLERTQGAFDGDQCVGCFRSFSQELTAVGGAPVAANAVTNVSIVPTHRRRGLLSQMMGRDLRNAKERGDAVATLIAAEYPIYGRYGFGPATWVSEWEVEIARAGLNPSYARPGDRALRSAKGGFAQIANAGGQVEMVDGAQIRAVGPALHDRLRARQHGVVSRDERMWRLETGDLRYPDAPWQEPYHALYRAPDGTVEGLVSYSAGDLWTAKLPENTATVRSLLTVSPEAESALWHFLFSVDWVARIASGYRAPDDVLPLLLGDPRAAKIRAHADWMWVRPLDVPSLLAARTYPVEGSLVLELHDAAGLAGGRFALDAGPAGASCAPTTRDADLTMDIGELGTLWLGDESATRLTGIGRIEEHRVGAAALADVLFRTARRPWCPDVF
ncbi:GNAT family N-acetyltransferase [Streptomyces zagrosensis]|uniref:Putative acetyltransferase n=1 Tax=Streptomyces zagrosensis TaxID=1042984 RepID=A0A7W9Q689_9ACTN|nr:GNAT family N-acetyltransferase [Streptomyces zagrosensis]MBB5934403.1 putative acetyltransferase [Streptomyces zagrosensis]